MSPSSVASSEVKCATPFSKLEQKQQAIKEKMRKIQEMKRNKATRLNLTGNTGVSTGSGFRNASFGLKSESGGANLS